MSTVPTEAVPVLESFSLDGARQAFIQELGSDTEAGPKISFGDFDWGAPICIEYRFNGWYTQKQLQGILTRATVLGMEMQRLRLGRDADTGPELIFQVRTKLLKP